MSCVAHILCLYSFILSYCHFYLYTDNKLSILSIVNQIVTVKVMKKKSKPIDNLMMRESMNLKMDHPAAPQSTMTPVKNLKSQRTKMMAVLGSPQNVVRLIEVMHPALLEQTVMVVWPRKSQFKKSPNIHSTLLLQQQT